jgi:hypothetical protein
MAEIHLMEISATAEIKIKLPRKIIIHPTRFKLQRTIYVSLHRGILPENTAGRQAQPGGARHRHESAQTDSG